jgi:hypothetical protein
VELALYGQNTIPRVVLGIDQKDKARVSLHDNAGRIRAFLGVNPVGTPTWLGIVDSSETVRAQIELRDDDQVVRRPFSGPAHERPRRSSSASCRIVGR